MSNTSNFFHSRQLSLIQSKVDVYKSINSCEWKTFKKLNKVLSPKIFEFDGVSLTETQILHKIQTDEFFGLVKCSIEIPQSKREKWMNLNFPPIINKRSVLEEECSPETRQMLEKRNIKFPLGEI